MRETVLQRVHEAELQVAKVRRPDGTLGDEK
jgi:hypothetical protein